MTRKIRVKKMTSIYNAKIRLKKRKNKFDQNKVINTRMRKSYQITYDFFYQQVDKLWPIGKRDDEMQPVRNRDNKLQPIRNKDDKLGMVLIFLYIFEIFLITFVIKMNKNLKKY